MNAYSPFTKELKLLEAVDLTNLMEATEGWYIEYKREIPNAISIAKSVSAFGNTYGGWLFYGISEKSKEEAVAGSFPGIARTEIDAGLQRVRQAVAALINPSPHFDVKVLWGPCEEIKLEADRAVICVHVPRSPTAPHVHKSGQIYRRVADGSEPKPENDRHLLDQLWQRSKTIRKVYKEWVSRDPELSKNERRTPYVRLMLVADLWGEQDAWTDAPIEEIRNILRQDKFIVSSVPFDTVYSSSTGIVGRQLTADDPINLGLTWKFNRNLSSDILIPLSSFSNMNLMRIAQELEGYVDVRRYIKHLHSIGHNFPNVVDLNFLFNIITALVETYLRLLDLAGWKSGYYIKARLLNVWRTVPFLDVPIVLDEFERHGLPMVMDSTVTTPPSSDPESFFYIEPNLEIDNEEARILLQALFVFGPIATSFGVTGWINTGDEDTAYYRELQLAGYRARDIQKLRNERRKRDAE